MLTVPLLSVEATAAQKAFPPPHELGLRKTPNLRNFLLAIAFLQSCTRLELATEVRPLSAPNSFRVLGAVAIWLLLTTFSYAESNLLEESADLPLNLSQLSFDSGKAFPPPVEPLFSSAPAVASPTEGFDIPEPASSRLEEWQLLPDGVMYPSYLAGEKEPRFGVVSLIGADKIWRWEAALGGRVALLRHGTTDPVRPEGWELQFEGAVLARIQILEPSAPLDATDYRFGLLSVWREGPWAFKAGYYHLSSHAGDEFILTNPSYHRLNYVRDSAIIGTFVDLTDAIQVYAEIAYAGTDGGAKPLELQYGIQYSPQGPTGFGGKPFAAVNGHTRQDQSWITSVNMTAGWQWRGNRSNHLWRLGVQHYVGPSMQWEFVGRRERVSGGGIWYDF